MLDLVHTRGYSPSARHLLYGKDVQVVAGVAVGGLRTTKSESWKDGRNLDTKINLRCKLFRTLEVDIWM